MNNLAVRVQELAKCYTIARDDGEATNTLGEAIVKTLKNPFRRTQTSDFWAIRDLSVDIYDGEVVGVIGRNGAGKSTFLKLLSRITEPTRGRIELYGRVGSLLEVGTGFHPELTGRENLFLNGAILGMKRKEIRRYFDEIVAFAGVEKFLDTPVKRYSSGMYVRLAFAVAAHLNPEILIVDEVLAVGDAEFQKKCLGKMQDVAESGRTVLFVSHNMAAVTDLCDRAILLHEGELKTEGKVEDVVDAYMRDGGVASITEKVFDLDKNLAVAPTRLSVRPHLGSEEFRVDEPFRIEIEYLVSEDVKGTAIVVVVSHNGAGVFEAFDSDVIDGVHENRVAGKYKATLVVPGRFFTAGSISVSLGVDFTCNMRIFNAQDVVSFDLVDTEDTLHTARAANRHNVVQDPSTWSVQLVDD